MGTFTGEPFETEPGPERWALAFFQNKWISHSCRKPSFNPPSDVLVWPGVRMKVDAPIRRVESCDELKRGDKARTNLTL